MSAGRRVPPVRRDKRVDPGPRGWPRLARGALDLPVWAYGMARTTVEYLWRWVSGRRPLRHTVVTRLQPPPEIVGGLDQQAAPDAQTLAHGVGPLFHRTYTARIRHATCSPEQLLEQLLSDFNSASPTEVARFERTKGEGRAAAGDEWVVRMPGPWDAPVRLRHREEQRFVLATLQGHMEAGSIEFAAHEQDDLLVFQIESWARSGDKLFDLLYDKLDLSREMQLHMWVHVAERAAVLSGGELVDQVEVVTERDPDAGHVDASAGS
ncbi:MAG: hypothetical protein ACTHMW_12585 [Actinomycetes bacterium]